MHENIQLFEETTDQLEKWFKVIEKSVPPPTRVPFGDSFVYRHTEQTAQQAIVQKLARIISSLRASHVLLLNGYVQELGVLQRTLGDLDEDVMFLSAGLMKEWTVRHDEFLRSFYEEEFDNPDDPSNSTQNRAMFPRDKIRAFNARSISDCNPSGMNKATRTLSKAYSGYVHAASPHIMDMFGGELPHFHLSGMLGTHRATEHLHDIWNYYYRAILIFGLAAHAVGLPKLRNEAQEYEARFQKASGRQS